jgi:hypothetical protein
MKGKNFTKSVRKLERYAESQRLDKVAMPLIRQGMGVDAAYRAALKEFTWQAHPVSEGSLEDAIPAMWR